MIVVNGLTKLFSNQGSSLIEALGPISFEVAKGEFVCIVGPTGCGKSTLLRIIAGLVKATSGEVSFDDSVSNTNTQKTAMVFQKQSLLPWLSVIDNVTLGLRAQGWSKSERDEAGNTILRKFGLAGFEGSKPSQLSGGMQQRAALARAFLSDPEVLLMDEPFRGLDAQTKLILQRELLRIWFNDQKTVIFVTHDIDEAIFLADRVIVMTGRPGQIHTIVPINIPRPRSLSNLEQPEAVHVKWQIWKMLEETAQAALL